MKLYIVRHADPDYSIDSLTPKGWKEAYLLADRLEKIEDAHYYCSPLGRANDTAAETLRRISEREGRPVTAKIMPWLREFDGKVPDPVTGDIRPVAWDVMPSYWSQRDILFDRDHWLESDYFENSDTSEKIAAVNDGVDEILAAHGYRREGRIYRAERANEDNVILFCHFGVESVILGHILGISPFALWHGFIALPTGVTVLNTEEREQGFVSFRCSRFGDLSHLDIAGEPEAFSGRFCETFDNTEQRH